LPIDVRDIGCDFLATTGRKFLRAPRGTGFLYVARDRIDATTPPMVEVGSGEWTSRDAFTLKPDARRFETWETSYALQLGLGRALDYALDLGIERIWARVFGLGATLRSRLAAMSGVTVHDLGALRCGIVTFSVGLIDALDVRSALARAGINVYVSGVSDTRLDLERRGLNRIVRASVHYFNTDEELGALCTAVEELAAR
jgi:selenocysteine lyase/cysteine desulfurase